MYEYMKKKYFSGIYFVLFSTFLSQVVCLDKDSYFQPFNTSIFALLLD